MSLALRIIKHYQSIIT